MSADTQITKKLDQLTKLIMKIEKLRKKQLRDSDMSEISDMDNHAREIVTIAQNIQDDIGDLELEYFPIS